LFATAPVAGLLIIKQKAMESVVLMPGHEVRELVDSLKDVVSALHTKGSSTEKEYVSNEEFMKMLAISKRTAQAWRDEGIIAFSQVGSKIWYSMADIKKLMQEHRREQFDDNKKRR